MIAQLGVLLMQVGIEWVLAWVVGCRVSMGVQTEVQQAHMPPGIRLAFFHGAHIPMAPWDP